VGGKAAAGRDVARHGLGGGSLAPPKQKYSPNEMKPISPVGLGLKFFARFVLKK